MTVLIYSLKMGYANLKQKGQGIHLRQYSRAFIIEGNDSRVVFVSVDAAMIGHALKREVCDIIIVEIYLNASFEI